MNYCNKYYGGVFFATQFSFVLVADNPNEIGDILNKVISVIPSESSFAQSINEAIKWHGENSNNWKASRHKTNQKWPEDIASPSGVFEPFNIDAMINSAWVVMGLLDGNTNYPMANIKWL